MYSYNLSESEGDDDLDDIRYAGYAWDEVMMPKQIRKNKTLETKETNQSASPNEVENTLLVKSQASILHSHIHETAPTLHNGLHFAHFSIFPTKKSLFNEISFDWKDPSPYSSPSKVSGLKSIIKDGVDTISGHEMSHHSSLIPTNITQHPSPIQDESAFQYSLVVQEESLLPEKSNTFSQFPTLISSQSTNRSKMSRNSNSNETKRDWSIQNRKWMDKRFPTSTSHPKTSLPSLPLTQMMESQTNAFSSIGVKRSSNSNSGSSNWKMKLDEEAIQLPDVMVQQQGEFALRMKQCILGRETLFQTCQRKYCQIYDQTLLVYDDYDYASILEISTQEAVHRILVYFHNGPYMGQICLFVMSSYILKISPKAYQIICFYKGYSVLRLPSCPPVLLQIDHILFDDDVSVGTILTNAVPQRDDLFILLRNQLVH